MNSGDIAKAILTVVGPLALLGVGLIWWRDRKWKRERRAAEVRRLHAKYGRTL